MCCGSSVDSCVSDGWFRWRDVFYTCRCEVSPWFLYLGEKTVVLGPCVGGFAVQCRFFALLDHRLKLVPGGLAVNPRERLGADTVVG